MKCALLLAVALLVPTSQACTETTCTTACRKHRTVRVTGIGTVERQPEQARLLLAVETTEPTARAASKENGATMGRLIERLKGMDLPKDAIRTVSISLTPKYEHDPQRRRDPRPIGFTARNMVKVTVRPVSRVGEVIDAATEAGANRIANLTYGLRDPQPAREEALREAMASARSQATVLAHAADQVLGPPLEIQTSGDVRPMESAQVFAHRASAATPVEAGAIRLTARVVITYALEDN